jgi:hypothetical protein
VFIAQILVIPVTVLGALILLRPFIRRLFERMGKLELYSVELKFEEIGEPITAGPHPVGNPIVVDETGKRIVQALEEGLREKLEKLKIALETQQVRLLNQHYVNSLLQSRVSFWFSIGAGTFGFLIILGYNTSFLWDAFDCYPERRVRWGN